MSEHNDFVDGKGKYFSVYTREYEEDLRGECVCGRCGKKCNHVVKTTTEIVEMYDEDGIDAGKRSKAYGLAVRHFRADKPYHQCVSCRYGIDIVDCYEVCDADSDD